MPYFPDGFQEAFERAESCDGQMKAVQQYFKMDAVSGVQDIKRNTFYYLRSKEQDHLVLSDDEEPKIEGIRLKMALSGKSLRPLPMVSFIELGEMQKLFVLTPKPSEEQDEEEEEEAEEEPESHAPESGATTHDSGKEDAMADVEVYVADKDAEKILDMGAFSQLFDAARRCGLVGGVEAIGHVRDREFRRGNYDRAFQVIQQLFRAFSAAATQRMQKLNQEERDIKSGAIQISPKQLQEKRARDRAQTQNVDRCQQRFIRVMEGLRMLTRGKVDDEDSNDE